MRTYGAFFVKSFKKNMAYRSQVWLRIVGNLITIFVQVAIWHALLGSGSANGVNFHDMVTYAILNTIAAAILMNGLFRDADERIRTGNIAIDLLRPLYYPLCLFADQLGKSVFQLVFAVVPTLLVATLLFGFTAPSSLPNALAFIFAIILALAISFAMGYLVALLAFWFLTTLHFEWALMGLITVFSGSFLPLWFFPPGWAEVARALPFQFLGFVPAAIYMGKLTTSDIWATLTTGTIWMLVLLGIIVWIWSASMKRLVIQGG